MGYNLSRYSVLRNKPQLEVLLKSRSHVYFDTPNPETLAYNIREALHAAKEHEEFAHYYHEIFHFYKFKTSVKGTLVAHRIDGEKIPARIADGEVKSEQEELKAADQRGSNKKTPTPVERTSVSDIVNLIEIMIYMQKSVESSEKEIHFPDARLNLPEQIKLHNWSLANEWQYIDHDGAGLTLTKNPVPENILWRPVS